MRSHLNRAMFVAGAVACTAMALETWRMGPAVDTLIALTGAAVCGLAAVLWREPGRG